MIPVSWTSQRQLYAVEAVTSPNGLPLHFSCELEAKQVAPGTAFLSLENSILSKRFDNISWLFITVTVFVDTKSTQWILMSIVMPAIFQNKRCEGCADFVKLCRVSVYLNDAFKGELNKDCIFSTKFDKKIMHISFVWFYEPDKASRGSTVCNFQVASCS